MKKYWLFTLLFVFVLCCFFCPSLVIAGGVPQEVLEASASVAYIEIETPTAIYSGSGFIVKNDTSGTYLATNNHVLETSPNEIYVWIGENKKRTANVIARSEQYDLAIIKLAEPIEGKALTLSEDAKQGDEVFAIGYPVAANYLSDTETHLSNEATITNGIIGSIHEMKNVEYGPVITMLQINADINEGNSGGPLLNRMGQVVGINTYGVLDTQGIFGAISASELKAYVEVNNLFQIDTKEMPATNWILYVSIAVAILVISVGLFFYVNKRKPQKRRKAKGLLLVDYLSSLDSQIDANSIVSLLMPVIIELRDMHNRGTVYLKISPSRLLVTKEGCSICSSDGQPTDEFISPEQRRGSFAGIKTDIYGVCAILRYITNLNSKKAYSNENNEVDANSIQLQEIINKGLAENMDDRFSDMQELLYALAPFNTGISVQAQYPFNSDKNKQPKIQAIKPNTPKTTSIKQSKKKRMLLSLGIVVVGIVLCGMLVYSSASYNVAMKYVENYEFNEASDTLDRIPFSETLFPEDCTYISAGVNVLDRDYEIAINSLSSIEDYKGSSELTLEAKYRWAVKLADEGSYEKAISLYEEIRKEGYEVSEEETNEIYYAWGLKLIEDEQIIEAYEKLLLADDDYLDAWQIADDMKEQIYLMGVDFYRSNRFVKAKNCFEVVGIHLDSDAYLTLIECHQQSNAEYLNVTADVSELIPLIEFEDTAEIIMSNTVYAEDFLKGTWKGGSNYFTMESDGSIDYNIPCIIYGDTFSIEDGIIYFCVKETLNDKRPCYRITIINENCINVFAYRNGKTYALYRRLI